MYLRKSFFCLPVRVGVIILCLLALLGGAVGTTGGWFEVVAMNARGGSVSIMDQAGLYAQAVSFSLLIAISIFGLISTACRVHALVSTCSALTVIHLALSLGTGGFYLFVTLRSTNDDEVGKCMNGSSEMFLALLCKKEWSPLVIGAFIIILSLWFVELYTYLLLPSLSTQLELDDAVRLPKTMSLPHRISGAPSMKSVDAVSVRSAFTRPAYGQMA